MKNAAARMAILVLIFALGIAFGAFGFKRLQDNREFQSQEFALAIDSGRGCDSDVFQLGVQEYLAQPEPRFQAVKWLVLGERQYNAKRVPPGKRMYADDLNRAKALSRNMPPEKIGNLFCQAARYEVDDVLFRGLVPIAMAVLDKPPESLNQADGYLIACGVANTTGQENVAMNKWLESGTFSPVSAGRISREGEQRNAQVREIFSSCCPICGWWVFGKSVRLRSAVFRSVGLSRDWAHDLFCALGSRRRNNEIVSMDYY